MSKLKSTARRPNRLFALAILLLALFALGIRTARIDERPFHCDEAVQAIKFGDLLGDGSYQYDPEEYHGPTLYYFSLPISWISGAENIEDVSEAQLRMIPAIFGVATILLLLLAWDGIGDWGVIAAAILTSISPFMVFFSRYYVQEMILVFFTLGAILSGWRYYRTERALWSILAGLCIGLMFATKETCIIAWFSLGTAFLLTARRRSLEIFRIHPLHALAAISAAVIVAALFFSSFGTHPAGIAESVKAYVHYFTRAAGEGHDQPWYHYLHLLFWHRQQGILWSELLIAILALIGTVRAHLPSRRTEYRLPRFLSYYTLTMLIVYSAIPYKTPWLALGFLQPAIMLAGYGAAALFRDLHSLPGRIAVAAFLIAAVANLGRQTWLGSFYYHADERNPCVYSHTSTDAVRAARQIHDIAALAPDGKSTPIKIIAPEYWPLPWYLRDFDHVGYWHAVPANPRAPIVISTPELAEKLRPELEGDYFTMLAGLRPGVFLNILIRRDLWDNYIESLN